MPSDYKITLDCIPISTEINSNITVNVSVINNGNYMPGEDVQLDLLDSNSEDNTCAYFLDNNKTRIIITTGALDAKIYFTDPMGESGLIRAKRVTNGYVDNNPQTAPFTFTGGAVKGSKYLFYRSKNTPNQISYVTSDDNYQNISPSTLVKNTNVSGTGTFVACLTNNTPCIIFIDQKDQNLKTVIFENNQWSEPANTLINSTIRIKYINQIEKIDDTYQIIGIKEDNSIISVLTMDEIENNLSYQFDDIRDAKSLSWPSYAGRNWKDNNSNYYLNAYHGTNQQDEVAIYQLYGNDQNTQKTLGRYTAAGNDLLNSGTYALPGNENTDDIRVDRIFFQYNNLISIITETVNLATQDKTIIPVRCNAVIDGDFYPVEGVSATYDSNENILIFGRDANDKMVIGNVNFDKDNNCNIKLLTTTSIEIASSFVIELNVQ